jgi:hypothetical protein
VLWGRDQRFLVLAVICENLEFSIILDVGYSKEIGTREEIY